MVWYIEVADCTCASCQAACKRKPGWFHPGEVEKVAEFLGITLQELFDKYLMVDSWETRREFIDILCPAVKGQEPGGRSAVRGGEGECVFFHDGLCSIHPVKPLECRAMRHDIGYGHMHREISKAWSFHWKQVATLLGNGR